MMRRLLLAPVFGGLAVAVPMLLLVGGIGATPMPLERTAWSVTVKPDALGQAVGMTSFEDTLVFRRKQVSLQTQRKLIAPCAYDVSQSVVGWSFIGPPGSAVDGDALWSGEVVGDTISGVMRRIQPSGSVIRFSFRGRRQDAT